MRPVRVGVTHGDINGISYELLLKAFSKDGITELCTPVLFCSGKLLSYFRKNNGIEEFRYNQLRGDSDVKDGEVNVFNISDEEFKVTLGEATEEGGRAALLALDAACQALKDGVIDVLVTAPINKEAMNKAGFKFPGHTEYLQEQLGEEGRDQALMIMAGDRMRVALTTVHVPLSEVPAAVTAERLRQTVTLFDQTLRRDYGIDRPKIAVLSLNPHAGDGGVIGTEDKEIIAPAIAEMFGDRMLVFGPFAADGFFGSEKYRDFDGVVAMYHDQGLIPFKTIEGVEGVNFTAGLPYVRVSPDHGTGYDIAGRNEADESSLLKAVYTAIDIYRNRQRHAEACANPLKKYVADKPVKKADKAEKTDLTIPEEPCITE